MITSQDIPKNVVKEIREDFIKLGDVLVEKGQYYKNLNFPKSILLEQW